MHSSKFKYYSNFPCKGKSSVSKQGWQRGVNTTANRRKCSVLLQRNSETLVSDTAQIKVNFEPIWKTISNVLVLLSCNYVGFSSVNCADFNWVRLLISTDTNKVETSLKITLEWVLCTMQIVLSPSLSHMYFWAEWNKLKWIAKTDQPRLNYLYSQLKLTHFFHNDKRKSLCERQWPKCYL